MTHLAVAVALSIAAALLVWSPPFRGVRLPLLTYFAAYIGTTVIGASMLFDDLVLQQFRLFLPSFHPQDFATLDSPLYWTLLVAPFVLVPLGARIGSAVAGRRPFDRLERYVPANDLGVVRVFYALAFLGAAWCAWKLLTTHNLFPDSLADRSIGCRDRITKRIQLITELRYFYYVFAYAVLPMGTAVAMFRWMQLNRAGDFALFLTLLIVTTYLNSVIYMKASLIVFIGTLLLACVVAKNASWRHYLVLGSLAILAFVAAELALGCYAKVPVTPPSGEEAAEFVHDPRDPNAAPSIARSTGMPAATRLSDMPPENLPSRSLSFDQKIEPSRIAAGLLRSPVFRMAASFPYYVEIFSDPGERCGIETNRLPLLPRERCFAPTKVFPRMYPDVTFVQGFAPAPAHVSAFAEAGLGYSFVVLVLGGFILGFSWRLSLHRASPLFWAIGTATCVFAYYLSQVSLTGALTYSHGLVWYFAPLALSAAIVRLNEPVRRALAMPGREPRPWPIATAALALATLAAVGAMLSTASGSLRLRDGTAKLPREEAERVNARLAAIRDAVRESGAVRSELDALNRAIEAMRANIVGREQFEARVRETEQLKQRFSVEISSLRRELDRRRRGGAEPGAPGSGRRARP
jgi:hypothetical protein